MREPVSISLLTLQTIGKPLSNMMAHLPAFLRCWCTSPPESSSITMKYSCSVRKVLYLIEQHCQSGEDCRVARARDGRMDSQMNNERMVHAFKHFALLPVLLFAALALSSPPAPRVSAVANRRWSAHLTIFIATATPLPLCLTRCTSPKLPAPYHTTHRSARCTSRPVRDTEGFFVLKILQAGFAEVILHSNVVSCICDSVRASA